MVKKNLITEIEFLEDLCIPNDLNIQKSKVLKSYAELEQAIETVIELGLVPHGDKYKNWDSLIAFLVIIYDSPCKNSRVLDAGSEKYSVILPWLSSYGFCNTYGINIIFEELTVYKNIIYEYGDIEKTKYPDSYFNYITCLSVLEHGVDVANLFREASRILNLSGTLVVRVDYWCENIDTYGQQCYDVPIYIFDEKDIRNMIRIAKSYNLELIGNWDLECNEKVVHWKQFNLDYTFIILTFKKVQ